MFKKMLIASATAGLIAAGGLAATTETASAGQRGYNFQFGNSGIYFNYGYRANPRRNCKPTFKRVRVRDHYGRPHWKRIKVGVQCFRPRHRDHQYRAGQPPRYNGYGFRPRQRGQQYRAWQNPRRNGFSFQFGF